MGELSEADVGDLFAWRSLRALSADIVAEYLARNPVQMIRLRANNDEG